MKEELGTTGAAIGSLVLACLFGGLVLAIYPGWDAVGKFLVGGSAPAWVQAVGSIGAIVGSVWVARYQTQKQVETEKRRGRELLRGRREGFLALLKYSRGIFNKISRATEDGSTVLFPVAAMMRIEIGGVHNQLRRLDIREFSDSEKLTEALSVSVAASELLLTEMDGYIQALHQGKADLPSLHQTAAVLRIQLGLCEQAVDEALKEFA